MKKLALLLLFLLSAHFFAQSTETIRTLFQKMKKGANIDRNDKAVYNLLDEFYNKSLQAHNDEMASETVEKIQMLASDKNTKNLHILMLFLMYQQHISQTAMVGKPSNSEFQIETMRLLEDETKDVYGKIPVIIYIYKYEALESGKEEDQARTTVAQGLKEYPDSVPLKVYSYLNTKNEAIKNDLIKNHANHWMVKQFEIQ